MVFIREHRCPFAPKLPKRPFRGSQVGNSCPFPALKGGLSPSCQGGGAVNSGILDPGGISWAGVHWNGDSASYNGHSEERFWARNDHKSVRIFTRRVKKM